MREREDYLEYMDKYEFVKQTPTLHRKIPIIPAQIF